MKLRTKFTFYSTLPKLVIIGLIILFLPRLIEYFVYRHTDQQLNTTRDQIVQYIQENGVGPYIGPEGISRQIYQDDFTHFLSVVPVDNHQVLLPEQTPPGNVRRAAESKIKDYRVLSQVVSIDGRPYQIEVGQSLDAIEQLEQSISQFAVYLMLVISGIVLAIDVGFTHMVLRPLRNIIGKLQKVKKPENFDFTPVRTTTQEFRYLDESINEMMQKITEAFLREKEFVGSASHEMLTPIAVLNSRFENMIADRETPEIISEKLVDSQSVLLRLNKIIKALLLISKVEYNYYLKEDTVNMHDLVEEVVTYSEDRIEARNITTKIEVDSDFVFENCNRSLLFTMLLNLISNAIKYNREGGNIFIRGSRHNGHYNLAIEDTGIGIPENELPHIFEGFKKLKTSEGESNRLGLHIVRSIANLHQISIEVQSEVDKGSVFTLRFPL